MHLVGFGLKPCKEALDAIPDAFFPFAFTFKHPCPLGGGEFTPGPIERDAALLREFLQILLALGIGLGLPRADRTRAQRLTFIRDDESVVDAHRAAEAATALAGAERGVEREKTRHRLAVGKV